MYALVLRHRMLRLPTDERWRLDEGSGRNEMSVEVLQEDMRWPHDVTDCDDDVENS